jgi:DNA-directed RNA polymerase specialized sigma24 family protein
MRRLLNKFGKDRKTSEKAEDIVNSAFMKWWISFDGNAENQGSNPESTYFLKCLWSLQSDFHKKDNPKVTIDARCEDRKLLRNETGKQIKIRMESTHLEYKENAYDNQDENDEENTFSDSFLPESEDDLVIENVSETEEIIEESVDTNEVFVQNIYPSQTSIFDTKSRKRLIKFGDKYFATVAEDEIARFYILSGKTNSAGRRIFSNMKTGNKPFREFVTDAVKPELHNITPPSNYHRNKLLYLKSADVRQWMELAISELRKSKEKMISDASQKQKKERNFDETKFKSKTPIWGFLPNPSKRRNNIV